MNKILVANRGEIAVRVIRTAQALGYETVAVFSEADADSPHVALADQAVLLGPPEVGASYLNVERVLAAAVQSGADGIHPGYGFLSENAEFARAVMAAGLTWIGPPPEAMEVMGNKAAAKLAIADTNVPCVPGYGGGDQSEGAFAAAADEIGYPVMVKAAAGGGGRGMRLVTEAADLPAALASARSEALKAFASGELLLEKAIVNPRHIEVQVFGDMQGNVVHLGERDCSIQRRHQKVVEEAPSPAVSPELRAEMGAAAVAAAEAVGYYGAGTVEFLLDESGAFYFIEMNTRLQVEHPVTEMVTGQDLVAWQLAVAEGRPFPLAQDEIVLRGHAIEVRLYAEDPQNEFLPSIGDVYLWQAPSGEGVRVDHGLASGMAITPFYDAMIAKIITYGETREVARRRLRRALGQTAVLGVVTNRRFLLDTAIHPVFAKGEATTRFITDHWVESITKAAPSSLEAVAALLLYRQERRDDRFDSWGSQPASYCFDRENRARVVVVTAVSRDRYEVQVGEALFTIRCVDQSENRLCFEIACLQECVIYAVEPDGAVWVQWGGETGRFEDLLLAPPENRDGAGSGNVIAPMPGAVIRIDVAEGDGVTKGQSLLILEAMKMEHAIVAPFDGVVAQLLVHEGQQMRPKELMLVVEERA